MFNSRIYFICTAFVLLICANSILPADGNRDGSRKGLSKHERRTLCYKTFPGCKTCSGTSDDEGGYTCDVCASSKAEFDGEGCVCVGDYGTLTRSQFRAWKRSKRDRKGAKRVKGGKHAGKHGRRCELCENYGLSPEDGVCVEGE